MNLIVARGINNEIGAGNHLLWRLPSDMKFFKETTTGNTIVMGWNTWESIGEKPLKDRTNVVLTNRYKEGIHLETINGKLVHFVSEDKFYSEFIKKYYLKDLHGEIFIIGGAKVYELFAKQVKVMYITEVEQSFPNADTFFTHPIGLWHSYPLGMSEENGIRYHINKMVRRI